MYTSNGDYETDIQGKTVANPVGQILSAALMLDYSFGLVLERKLMEESVRDVLRQGFQVGAVTSLTQEVATASETQERRVLTDEEFGDQIVEAMRTLHVPK